MRSGLTISGLQDLGLHGAIWRALEVTDERAVVELCNCSGEPMDVVAGDAPELIEFVRARPATLADPEPAPAPTPPHRGQPLDELRGMSPVVRRPPTPASRGPRPSERSASARRTARRSAAGARSRHGRRTPTPAQSARAAFSAMSPTWGTASTGHPQASARAIVPWPA